MRAPGSGTVAATTAATTAALTPQQIADAVRVGMYAADCATQSLGITVDAIAPGAATLRMTVRPDMLNGLAGCHGAMITTLADSAFAFACNSYNELTVASGLAIELLASAREGDVLAAAASEVSRLGRPASTTSSSPISAASASH